MAVPIQPSKGPSMATLSLNDSGVVNDELEAFRRAWRAEVEAKKEVDVDVGGVKWKGTEEGKVTDKGKRSSGEYKNPKANANGDDEWPEPGAPVKAVRSRSPVKAPLSPVKSTSTSPKTMRSPTKAQFPSPTAPKQLPVSQAQATRATIVETEPDESGSESGTDSPMPFPQRRRTGDAVGLYTRAVEAEQEGRLSDALHLYRRAFRADENVDRLYALNVRKAAAAPQIQGEKEEVIPTPVDIVDPSVPDESEYTFTREVQVRPDYEREGGRVSPLTALLEARVGDPESFPDEAGDPAMSFRAADAALPLPISKLPSELLDRILLFLDVGAQERFGASCWRARLLTAHGAAWKRLAEQIYLPPMVESVAVGRGLARRHRDEWRTTIVEEERLRMDGAYISVCHYIRPGAGEQWVTITHMITYHRFLRFYPDGHVISFLTTDHPSDVVPLLKPTLRAKGLHFGRWRLVRAEDERGRKRPRVLVTDLVEPGVGAKYEFEMELTLRETGRGRWNKLDLVSYSSINLATGEALGLSLKHQKPFYFSKVRSYKPPF